MSTEPEAGWWPVSPFVRGRWRRRLGLPEAFVAEVGVDGAPDLDERTASHALFLCAAAVVGPDDLRRALALGTPTVCSSDAAAALGAEDGVHVVVADDGAHAAALVLAADGERAAMLARAGRALVAERPVGPLTSGPAEILGLALAELGTPPGSDITRRVGAHVASLGPSAANAVATLSARAEPEVAPLPDEESAARVAAAFGLSRSAPIAAPAPTPPTIRQRLAGKSAGDIARAVVRRVLHRAKLTR